MVFVPKYRLLITDDDPAFRSTLKLVFEAHFELLEAECGEEAIEIGSRQRIDIALMDMNMGRLTGLETIRILRSIHRLTPFILVTADATDELRKQADEAYEVLRKPVTRAELMATVSSAIADVYHDPDGLLPHAG